MLAGIFVLLLATTAPNQDLAKLKASVMAADYKGDLTELARLRDELAKWPKDRPDAYLARYWSGFASWRMAINGANQKMTSEELTKNLKEAASSFYAAIKLKDDFADAYAAAAGVNGWLANSFGPNADRASVLERVYLAYALLSRATILDPHNPRVLWIQGGFQQFAPGGSVARAIDVYAEMLKEAERRGLDASSPLPDWGRAEALMSLASAHSSLTPPDLTAARAEASAALKLVPEWSYVRDILLPQLDQRTTAH